MGSVFTGTRRQGPGEGKSETHEEYDRVGVSVEIK